MRRRAKDRYDLVNETTVFYIAGNDDHDRLNGTLRELPRRMWNQGGSVQAHGMTGVKLRSAGKAAVPAAERKIVKK